MSLPPYPDSFSSLGHPQASSPMLRGSSSGQRRAHEVANVIDGFLAFRKKRLVGLEHVEHARPDFELDWDSVRTSLLRHPDAVVAEHLVLPDLDEQRRN